MRFLTIEFRMAYDLDGHTFWIRNYWLGTITSAEADWTIQAAFLGKIASVDGWLTKWRDCMTIGTYIRLYRCQIIQPHRGPIRDESLFFFGTTGFIISGTQSWHATCRIRWFSNSADPSPKWWQLSPVPEFTGILALPEWEYLERVNDLAELFRAGITTAHGDKFVGAVRQKNGVVFPLIGHDVQLFKGRQKTRRRVL